MLAQRRRRRSIVRITALVALLVIVNGAIVVAVRSTGGTPVARLTGEPPAGAALPQVDRQGQPRADRPAIAARPSPQPQIAPPVVTPPSTAPVQRAAVAPKRTVPVSARPQRPQAAHAVTVMRVVPALPLLAPIPPTLPATPPVAPQIAPPPAVPLDPVPPEAPPPVTIQSLPDPPSVTTLWLEAESADLQGQMETAVAPGASGEQAIGVPITDDSGEASAELRFELPEDGTYAVWTRVDPGEDPQTLTFSLDDAEPRPCPSTGGYDGWTWYPVEPAADLDAGEHVLEIASTPDGTQVDVILVTDDLGYTPTGSEPGPGGADADADSEPLP